MPTRVRSRSGWSAASACRASTWSSSTGPARSPHTARSNAGPRPGAPPVDDHDGEALLGEPLAGQMGAAGGDDALGVRAAVGVHEHRQRRPRPVPRRQQQCGAQRPPAAGVQGDPGLQPGRLGVRGDHALGTGGRANGRERAVGVERLPRDDERSAGQPTAVHPRLRRETAQPVGRGPGPQRDGDRIVRGAEQHRVVVDVEHGADLQRRRRDRLAVDQQAACVAVVGDPQQGAGRGAGRHSGDDLDPVRVRVLVHEGRRSGRRVDPQHPQGALVAGLHDDEQLVGGPHHVRQVLVPDGVPGHVDPGPVEPDDDERDPCVGGARGRIGDDRRLPVGIGGVRDVPAAHRGVVDPRDQQRPAVRRPPVPPHPAHLLGRDEVGEPVGDGAPTRGWRERWRSRSRGRGRAVRRR